ncbi:MAG: hypothetical protein IPJ88_09845 [Myxococcales bacterium]|nr:MAG: hypothetical protein IPJ88_09845 [Myxococcales bacterium]
MKVSCLPHLTYALFLPAVLVLSACASGGQISAKGTKLAPKLSGSVQSESLEGGNQLIIMKLYSLPKPDQLGKDLNTFMVWFIQNSNEIQRAGALEFDETKRHGFLMAATPMHHFQVMVTAEPSDMVSKPGETLIFKTSISN